MPLVNLRARALERRMREMQERTVESTAAMQRAFAGVGRAAESLTGTLRNSMPRHVQPGVEHILHGALRPMGILRQIAVSVISSGRLPLAPSDFVQSVRDFGILQPIIVVEYSTPSMQFDYKLVAGRRRLAAALATNMMMVPAIVYPHNTPESVLAAMSLTENYQRSENAVQDMHAILALVEAGVPEVRIAEHLGLSISQVRSRRALHNLIPAMRIALQEGDLSVRLANSVARMPTSSQRALRRIWGRHDGGITQEMVEQAEGEHDPATDDDVHPVDLTRSGYAERIEPAGRIEWGVDAGTVTVDNSNITARDQFSVFRVIDANLIEAGGQQYIRFAHHQEMVRRLEQGARNAVEAAGRAYANMSGVEPVAGTAMIRYGNATYITLEEHNRLVTQATRRARPVETAQGTRSQRSLSIAQAERIRVEAYEQGRQSVLPQLETRIPVTESMPISEVIDRLVHDRSYSNAVALLDAAARALPAQPTRQSDELHEAVGLVRDMVRATV